jgi:hypothetical protein
MVTAPPLLVFPTALCWSCLQQTRYPLQCHNSQSHLTTVVIVTDRPVVVEKQLIQGAGLNEYAAGTEVVGDNSNNGWGEDLGFNNKPRRLVKQGAAGW